MLHLVLLGLGRLTEHDERCQKGNFNERDVEESQQPQSGADSQTRRDYPRKSQDGPTLHESYTHQLQITTRKTTAKIDSQK